MSKLSIVIATYNEQKNIGDCLESIIEIADEIIIVDANSEDKTVQIAKKFNARVFTIKNNPIFHINKQYGLDKATSDWILQLDADEVVTSDLKKEILDKVNGNYEFSGYYIPRKNYFLGSFMKKGGLYPDYVIRLFKKGKGSFPQKSVHEQITIDGSVGYLVNPMLHYSFKTVTDYLIKANRYTSLTADELKKQGIKVTTSNTIKYCLFIPFKTFASIYIRHIGFLDGFRGFVWAFLSSTHYFFAYSKLINTK